MVGLIDVLMPPFTPWAQLCGMKSARSRMGSRSSGRCGEMRYSVSSQRFNSRSCGAYWRYGISSSFSESVYGIDYKSRSQGRTGDW
jgi:hypothetical protein